jgi:hypothetical protein
MLTKFRKQIEELHMVQDSDSGESVWLCSHSRASVYARSHSKRKHKRTKVLHYKAVEIYVIMHLCNIRARSCHMMLHDFTPVLLVLFRD